MLKEVHKLRQSEPNKQSYDFITFILFNENIIHTFLQMLMRLLHYVIHYTPIVTYTKLGNVSPDSSPKWPIHLSRYVKLWTLQLIVRIGKILVWRTDVGFAYICSQFIVISLRAFTNFDSLKPLFNFLYSYLRYEDPATGHSLQYSVL